MDKSQDSDRTPNSVDQHVGMRVRVRRRALGISQEKLSEALNLTFQQVQKYERGANRISASKLYDIARALQAPISYFFEGLADPVNLAIGAVAEPDGSEFLYEMVMTTEGMELAALFPRIDRRRRKLVLELARALSDEFNEPAAGAPD
jgi:transcriptional regulator with XRE-family HTH domain